MTKISGLSPLSTRDLNRNPNRKEEDDYDILHREDDAIGVEKIKARFERDFLPKYGHLWRRIIRENQSREVVSDTKSPDITITSSVKAPLPDPRAIDFLEAIERKQVVSIRASAPHGEECECCAPPIEEFKELDEEKTKCVTMDRKNRRSYSTQSSESIEANNSFEAVQNSTEFSKSTMSDEETETEIDEGDVPSVYETADEFEDEVNGLENTQTPSRTEDKPLNVPTDNIEHGENGKKNGMNEETVIIDIDSSSDEMEDDTSNERRLENIVATRNHKNDKENLDGDEIVGDDEEGSLALDLSEYNISAKEEDTKERAVSPTIDARKRSSRNRKLFEDTLSSSGYNSTSKTAINDPFVDSDDEADNEYDTESDDSEEAEWVPDDESLLPSPKSTPQPKKITKKCDVERQKTTETIDLCDSSSSDELSDTDFTLSDDDDDDSLDCEKQDTAAVVKKKQGKGRSKASFRRNRDQITTSALDEFNRKAFRGKLDKVVVEWSKKLNTTAGLTRLQKIRTDMTPGIPLKRVATIELSTKVVDDEEKLRTTLLHELVHAAVWIFEGVSRPPHGPDFKRWAKIAMSKVPDVTVTTTHNYQIQYKFNWACVNPKCSFTVGRHSKSVDTIRHRCGKCRGKLIEVTSDGAPKKRAQPSAYNLFVKEQSKAVREQLVKKKPGVTQADVMKELGRLWREQKNGRSGSANE